MITNQRAFEILTACNQLIKSPNITEFGKEQAGIKRVEMHKFLSYYSNKKVKEE